MWWLVYALMCAGLAAISRGGSRAALLLILCGLAVVQVWKVAGLGDLIWLAFAATWVAVAGAMLRVDAGWRHRVTFFSLTLASAACYPLGRVGNFAFAPGDPIYVSPLFWADMALVSAILVAGGPGIVGCVGRLRDVALDRLRAGRGVYAGRGVALSTAKKGAGT
jgi:hypothetical protein